MDSSRRACVCATPAQPWRGTFIIENPCTLCWSTEGVRTSWRLRRRAVPGGDGGDFAHWRARSAGGLYSDSRDRCTKPRRNRAASVQSRTLRTGGLIWQGVCTVTGAGAGPSPSRGPSVRRAAPWRLRCPVLEGGFRRLDRFTTHALCRRVHNGYHLTCPQP